MSDNEITKNHYRKVFKSEHLGVADLEEYVEAKKDLIFTITKVRQETNIRVAGKAGNFNIAYFKDSPEKKPMVLNAGNSKIIKKLAGDSPFVEDWNNILVELYIDSNVRAVGGGTTSGVRIREASPVRKKREVTKKDEKLWDGAKKAFLRDGNFDKVLERAIISEENMKLICDEIEKTAVETGNPNS